MAKLPPPKNRNRERERGREARRTDILTILTCGASERARGAPPPPATALSAGGRIPCPATTGRRRRFLNAPLRGQRKNYLYAQAHSMSLKNPLPRATQILSVKANSSKNSDELVPILLLADSRMDGGDGPTNYSGGRATKKRSASSLVSLRADELIPSNSLVNDRRGAEGKERCLSH